MPSTRFSRLVEMEPRIVIEKGYIMNYACSSSSIFRIRQKNPTNVWKRNVTILYHHQHPSMKIWSHEDHFACDYKMIHFCFICLNTRELQILCVIFGGHTAKERSLQENKRTASVIICFWIHLGTYQS